MLLLIVQQPLSFYGWDITCNFFHTVYVLLLWTAVAHAAVFHKQFISTWKRNPVCASKDLS